MQQPQGFVDPLHPQYVCKLCKSLYGLKQAPIVLVLIFYVSSSHTCFQASTVDNSFSLFKALMGLLLIFFSTLMPLLSQAHILVTLHCSYNSLSFSLT